jgi:hypothetical protein
MLSGVDRGQEQPEKTVQTLERSNVPPPPRPEPHTTPSTVEELMPKLSAAEPAVRWAAARQIALLCSQWAGPGRKSASDPRAPYCSSQVLHERLLPVLLDALDHHGDDTVSYGASMLGFLGGLGLKDASVKGAVERALKRDQERLAALEAELASIQDKAVPERAALRSKIKGYQAAVRDLKAALAGW